MLKRHRGGDQLSGCASTYDNALNDPCTKAAIIPNGLDKALKHIASKSPRLESDTRFQRLLTLSRR